jgi:hypothetical protein
VSLLRDARRRVLISSAGVACSLPLHLKTPDSQSPWWANMCAILFHPALGEAAQNAWKETVQRRVEFGNQTPLQIFGRLEQRMQHKKKSPLCARMCIHFLVYIEPSQPRRDINTRNAEYGDAFHGADTRQQNLIAGVLLLLCIKFNTCPYARYSNYTLAVLECWPLLGCTRFLRMRV